MNGPGELNLFPSGEYALEAIERALDCFEPEAFDMDNDDPRGDEGFGDGYGLGEL